MQTNIRWPLPVDQRLNELIACLGEVGVNSTRSQLVSALVTAAPTNTADLQQILMAYAAKSAGGVVLQPRGPIEVPDRKPGRRALG